MIPLGLKTNSASASCPTLRFLHSLKGWKVNEKVVLPFCTVSLFDHHTPFAAGKRFSGA